MALKLSATLEDYLITVYRLECEKRVARPRDIAREQNVAKSTVTAALKSLADKNLINYEPYESVTLTDEGKKRAQPLEMRHRILMEFLREVLDLSPETAEKAACGMEHGIEEEALERIVCFISFTKKRQPGGADWLKEFRKFIRKCGKGKICRECIEEFRKDAPNSTMLA